MPGFCFSPAMINQTIHLMLKGGSKLAGIVVEVNPAEVILKHPKNNNLIRINRDEVQAFSGFDDKQRIPDPLRLCVTRCYNMATRCNGVKRINVDPHKDDDYSNCPAHNEYCELHHINFFNLTKQAQLKLLNGVMVGSYPEQSSDIDEEEKHNE